MLVGIHQLHYLPWLRYFEKIVRSDVFIVLDNIQYNKNGWQNRNKIKTSQGATLLTVPILSKHQQNLDDVLIASDKSWGKKHWRTIEQAYGKAPFFDLYKDELHEIYIEPWNRLNDLNRRMLEWYLTSLGIDTRIEYSSALDVPGDATERLINLIHAVDGDHYYSGAYALDVYLDEQKLNDANIRLELQTWVAPEYEQLHGEFVSDLAMLDLMMHCGPQSLDVLMGQHA